MSHPAERHIEIVDPSSGNRVVTAIELLRQSNKVGQSRRQAYRDQQRQHIQGGVNLSLV